MANGAASKRRCTVCRTEYGPDVRFCPRDGAAVVDDDATIDPIVGRTIDERYLVRRLLGRGGMGAVYLADHVGLDKVVAIKFLPQEGRSADAVARFRREARAASRVTHEHVVQIFDVGATDGIDFIVMEYVEGRDLRRALDDGPLAPARAVAIARQMLHGLHAIHAAGIVHRDVKPANVLLAARDFVKLSDFGIAKSVRELGEPITQTGQMVGTPQFMAPEQFLDDVVDPRSDIYSAGVTLYLMLAGELPFGATTVDRVAAMHLAQPPPLERMRGMSPVLVAALERALQKDPAARFPDARAFADALERGVADAERPTLPQRTPRPPETAGATVPEPRPSPKPWLIVAVLAAALLAAVAWLALRPPSVAASRDASVPVASVPSDAPQTDAAALPPPPPPRDAAPPPDAASAVHHAAAPLPYCICLPVRPPTSSMCKVATAPRCRCISNANEVRLCPDAFELCNDCTRTTGSHYVCPDTRCDRDYGMLPCSDPDFAKLHALGHKHDEPCDGFPMFRNSTRIPGHYSCSYCDVAFSYRGHDGEPCKGFRFESGDPSEGHLDHCTLTPPRE